MPAASSREAQVSQWMSQPAGAHYGPYNEDKKRLYIPGDLAASLDKEQVRGPFRGMRPHPKHDAWFLHYQKQYVGLAAKTAWSEAFLTLSQAQQERAKKEKELRNSSASSSSSCTSPGPLRGHHLRGPRLTYFAVGAVVQDGMQGDLAAAAKAEVSHKAMFTAEPGLWLASLQGKYWPWKSAVAESWAECQSKPPVPAVPEVPEAPSRATKFWRVLHRAVQLMDGRPYHQWHNHCGRSVAFHSGFLKLVQDLGLVVISPPAADQPGAWAPINLSCTAGRKHYLRVAASSASCPTVVQLQVDKYLAAADQLNSDLSSPPTTCLEYISKFKSFKEEISRLRAPHVGGGYTVPWTFRSAAVARMRAFGIEALAEPEAVSPAEFAAAFPDQNDWIGQLQGSSPCQTLADFAKLLSYQGPPELLTMKLCLHLEGDLQLYNPAWLWQHANQLHSGAQELAGQLGFFPHIAVYLQMLREQWDAEQAVWPELSLRLTEPELSIRLVPAVPAVPQRRLKGKGDPNLRSCTQTKKARTATFAKGKSSTGAQSTDDVVAVPSGSRAANIAPGQSGSSVVTSASPSPAAKPEDTRTGVPSISQTAFTRELRTRALQIPSSWQKP